MRVRERRLSRSLGGWRCDVVMALSSLLSDGLFRLRCDHHRDFV